MAYSTRAGWLVLAAALAWPGISKADETPDEMARQHFESGVAYLRESDFNSALTAFQKAYDLSGRPKVLINIATAHERLGQPGLAADDLEKYLALEPDSEDRATLEVRIKNLRKQAAETQPEVPPAAPPPAAPAAPQQTTTVAAPAPKPAPPPEPAQPDRIPAYVAFGVAGASAVGAVVTQLLAGDKHDNLENSCSPSCTDDDVSGGKALAWTSIGLTGLAVVGAAVGGVLWFTAEPSSERAAATPRVFVTAGPSGAAARASWSF